jgi:nitroreductase
VEIQKEIDVIEFIKSRRSSKNFIFKKLPQEVIKNILECGRYTLDEKSDLPYRINVITHSTVKLMLAELNPKNQEIFETAYCCFVVLLDLEKSGDRTKDLLTIGAIVENLLLAIHATPNIGAIWIDEILSKKEEVNKIFKLDAAKFELMCVIAFGVVKEEIEEYRKRERKERPPISDFTDWY